MTSFWVNVSINVSHKNETPHNFGKGPLCARARGSEREREGERDCRTVFICYALSFELCDLVECALRLGCVCVCVVYEEGEKLKSTNQSSANRKCGKRKANE